MTYVKLLDVWLPIHVA